MHDADIIQILLSVLLGVLGFIGVRVHLSIDKLNLTLESINGRINNLDARLVRVETTCTVRHGAA